MRSRSTAPAIIATNDGLAARMPDAVQSVIEGAGHMAPITHPKPVAEVVRELLERS
ncbi:alpha/beta fold hydrolase [Marimonas sp. MJW-29]|uniref:Alpha/beta fold hydrolase n=1 Tax=Sulfitobacter sediminis TaxID=3234186 RepID=A0ABV3RL03_9RHOB